MHYSVLKSFTADYQIYTTISDIGFFSLLLISKYEIIFLCTTQLDFVARMNITISQRWLLDVFKYTFLIVHICSRKTKQRRYISIFECLTFLLQVLFNSLIMIQSNLLYSWIFYWKNLFTWNKYRSYNTVFFKEPQ